MRVQIGDRFKVKSTPWARKHGIRAPGHVSKHDDHIWPGEIGTVERHPYTTQGGETLAVYRLVFDRGRSITLQGITLTDTPEFYPSDAGDFLKVQAPIACPHHGAGHVVTCGGNRRHRWCEACDPAPSALCHWCHGRGYSTAPIRA